MITHFNQTPIHYNIIGKGPCIVLLHGFLLSSSIWDELVPKLSKKNKVIIIDLPSHGKSGCMAEIHSMELMAEVINFILEKNNIDQASFIGHSMGGYISLAFTEKYESKVNALILLNSTTEKDSAKKIPRSLNDLLRVEKDLKKMNADLKKVIKKVKTLEKENLKLSKKLDKK